MCGRFPARISQNDGMLRPTIVATNCWSAFITKRHIAMSPKSRESEVLLMVMVAEGGSTVFLMTKVGDIEERIRGVRPRVRCPCPNTSTTGICALPLW